MCVVVVSCTIFYWPALYYQYESIIDKMMNAINKKPTTYHVFRCDTYNVKYLYNTILVIK